MTRERDEALQRAVRTQREAARGDASALRGLIGLARLPVAEGADLAELERLADVAAVVLSADAPELPPEQTPERVYVRHAFRREAVSSPVSSRRPKQARFNMPGRLIVKCSCGATYTHQEWRELPLLGVQRDPAMLSWGQRALSYLAWWRIALTVAALLVLAYGVAWGIDALTHVSPLLSAGALIAVAIVGSVAAWRWGALLLGFLLGCGGAVVEHQADDAGEVDAPAMMLDAHADVARDGEVDAGELPDAPGDAVDAGDATADARTCGAPGFPPCHVCDGPGLPSCDAGADAIDAAPDRCDPANLPDGALGCTFPPPDASDDDADVLDASDGGRCCTPECLGDSGRVCSNPPDAAIDAAAE